MPSGNTRRQCSARRSRAALDLQNQSKLNGTSVDNLTSNKLNEASSSIPSINETRKNVKRPLQNELDIEPKIKKTRLTRNRGEKLNVKCLNSKNEEHHISAVTGKVDNIAKPIVITNGHDDEFFSKMPNNANNQDVDSPCKLYVSTEENKNSEGKSSSLNKDVNICVPKELENKIESPEKNNINEINHKLNKSLSSKNVVILNNSGDNSNNSDINEDLQIKTKHFKAVNEAIQTKNNSNSNESKLKNIENSTNNDLHLCMRHINDQTLLKITSKIQTIENDPDENQNKGEDSMKSNNEAADFFLDINIVNKAVRDVQKRSSQNILSIKVLFQLFENRNNFEERIQSYFFYKLMEYFSHRWFRGKDRYELNILHEIINVRSSKLHSIIHHLHELEVLVKQHNLDVNPNIVNPHIIYRDVWMQVDLVQLSPLKEDGWSNNVPRLLNTVVLQSDSDPVDISSDDNDDVVIIDVAPPELSLSTNEKDTKKKKSPIPRTSKLSTESNTKTVPPSIPQNSSDIVNIDHIDLTENDEVNEVLNKVNLDKANKVINQPTINTSGSPVTLSPQLTRNLSTQALPKNLAYIELPQLPPSSSYIVKTSATGSNQLTPVPNLKTVSIDSNSPYKPIFFKSSGQFGKLVPVQIVDPKRLQPSTSAVTYSPHQIPASQLIRPQIVNPRLIRPQLITAQLTRSSLTMPPLTRSHLTMPPLTRPQLPKTQLSRSKIRPVPPAIPIHGLQHPAPLPSVPNQRSLPSWKKMPPPPTLTVSESTSAQRPRGIVLSWTLDIKRSMAEISNYEIYVYHVTDELPRSEKWTFLGQVNALPLPMACTLTQFQRLERYYFAVRAVDSYTRVGPFSEPQFVMIS